MNSCYMELFEPLLRQELYKRDSAPSALLIVKYANLFDF